MKEKLVDAMPNVLAKLPAEAGVSVGLASTAWPSAVEVLRIELDSPRISLHVRLVGRAGHDTKQALDC